MSREAQCVRVQNDAKIKVLYIVFLFYGLFLGTSSPRLKFGPFRVFYKSVHSSGLILKEMPH